MKLAFKTCFLSCKNCSLDNNDSNFLQHNCIKCRENFYPSPENKSNCFPIVFKKSNWYFDSDISEFRFCHEGCSSCSGPSEFNCTSCSNGLYLDNNSCKLNCTEGNYPVLKELINSNFYFKCDECYKNCKTCFKGGNATEMNCEKCKDNQIKYNNNCFDIADFSLKYFYEPENNYNLTSCYEKFRLYIKEDSNECIPLPNKEEGYYILNNKTGLFSKSYNNSSSNNDRQNKDVFENMQSMESEIKDKSTSEIFESHISVNDFKNQIRDNINSYINSSKVINGSNFVAIVLSSDNINSEEQLRKGISAVDLGNCTNVMKEYYNIPKEENLIILNMETKYDESQKNASNNNDDKSFNLGKNTQLEIYDHSVRKLNLSFCKEDIKIMRYIGDIQGQLDMNSAESLSNQSIDVFNGNDEFFNDICHQYDSSDGKDIILIDRRNELYQDATFCQDGCTYNGINYNLKAVNCICDSSKLQEEDSIANTEKKSKDNKFQSLTKSFISNLIDFNFDVLRCYNLTLNTKILTHNIGFYCLSLMFVLQIIFFFVYLIKKLKPLKNFMLIFKINNNKNNYQNNNKTNNWKKVKNRIKSTPPSKKKYFLRKAIKGNIDNKGNKKKKLIKNEFIKNQKVLLDKKQNILNFQNFFQSEDGSNKTLIVKNNYVSTINISKPIINILFLLH